MLGRTFAPDDDRRRGQRHAVPSHAYWKERLAGDAAVPGRTINVDTFGGGPLPSRDAADRGTPWYLVFARLKSGITADCAGSELNAIARRISQQHPAASRVAQVKIMPLRETLVGEHRLALWTLFGAVGCVLLIGCANVANLVLWRGAGRLMRTLAKLQSVDVGFETNRLLSVSMDVTSGPLYSDLDETRSVATYNAVSEWILERGYRITGTQARN